MSIKSRARKIGSSTSKRLKGNMLLAQPFEWTDKQKELIGTMVDYNTKAVFVEGPAGCGKSVCAIYAALNLLNQEKVEKIIYIRSVVESSQSHLGFLPGDAQQKTSEWFRTAFEACSNFLLDSEIEELVKSGRIEFAPISFLRGRNFKNAVIIVEECQNIYYKEHITILTRCADNCRIFLMGDSRQTDIKKENEFSNIYEKLMDMEAIEQNIHVRFFGPEDIKRSPLVRFLVERLEVYKRTI